MERVPAGQHEMKSAFCAAWGGKCWLTGYFAHLQAKPWVDSGVASLKWNSRGRNGPSSFVSEAEQSAADGIETYRSHLLSCQCSLGVAVATAHDRVSAVLQAALTVSRVMFTAVLCSRWVGIHVSWMTRLRSHSECVMKQRFCSVCHLFIHQIVQIHYTVGAVRY